MSAFRLANLDLPPSHISLAMGPLAESQAEWIQPANRWGAIFYYHENVAGVDAHTIKVQPGDAVFFPPGSRGWHGRIGADTNHWFLLFTLPGTEGELYSIPLHYRGIERFQPELERAGQRVFVDLRALKAFAWSLMWAVARDRSVARVREELYAAEEFILHNLSSKLTVVEIADAAGRSPRQLLRSFREEHGTTIQEFIRKKRAREATRLLSVTNLAPKEIAARVGVPDLQAFNKLVREETGLAPRSFRKNAEEERSVLDGHIEAHS